MKLKYFLIASLIGLVTFPALAFQAHAAEDPFRDVCQSEGINSSTCQSRTTQNPLLGPAGLLTRVIQILSVLIGITSVIMVLVGGFKYVISTGDPNKVSNAKDTILYAVIGLVVALFSQAIVSFVLTRL